MFEILGFLWTLSVTTSCLLAWVTTWEQDKENKMLRNNILELATIVKELNQEVARLKLKAWSKK